MAAPDVPAEGVLRVDKPAGPTSHDIVARGRRALGTRRIGHTGTLDPFASGLLLLCVGRATRIAEYLSGADKSYAAVVRLGISTDTDDATGRITADNDSEVVASGGRMAADVTLNEIENALDAQRGEILQTPPAYSAKKVDGERSYTLAREGRAVALQPVPVVIHEILVMRYTAPELHLFVTCSSGTYIRAIARDLGAALGVGAHLTALRRTSIGALTLEGAIAADVLDNDPAAARAALLPTLDALGDMPRLELLPDDVVSIRHGRALRRSAAAVATDGTIALASNGELIAIAEVDGELIRPRKVFN